MATGTDNFDTYTTGALVGQGAGTGWSGNWTNGSGSDWTVETSVFLSSPNGVSSTASGAVKTAYRLYASGQSTGYQGFAWRISTTSSSENDMSIASGGNGNGNAIAAIRMNGSDIFGFGPGFGSTVTALTGVAANTWYVVEVRWSDATGKFALRAKVDGGSFGSWTADIGYTNALTNADRVILINSDNTSGPTQYFDSFYDATPASGPANVKTKDGVTQSTGIKTYESVALASVKTVEGVA